MTEPTAARPPLTTSRDPEIAAAAEQFRVNPLLLADVINRGRTIAHAAAARGETPAPDTVLRQAFAEQRAFLEELADGLTPRAQAMRTAIAHQTYEILRAQAAPGAAPS